MKFIQSRSCQVICKKKCWHQCKHISVNTILHCKLLHRVLSWPETSHHLYHDLISYQSISTQQHREKLRSILIRFSLPLGILRANSFKKHASTWLFLSSRHDLHSDWFHVISDQGFTVIMQPKTIHGCSMQVMHTCTKSRILVSKWTQQK
jgi:hypothetical protein